MLYINDMRLSYAMQHISSPECIEYDVRRELVGLGDGYQWIDLL